MPSVLRIAALGCLIAIALSGPVKAQNENAKWFVLRQETTSYCWTGLLIEMNGEYAHSFALLAGGPYDTKQEALNREKELEREGTCANAS